MVATRKSLIWSPEAIVDLESIWDFYIDAAGQRTAETVVRKIVETCTLIEEHPHAGRARDEVRPGLRSLATHPNIIFYRIRDGAPEIMRVLDGRRDIDSIFEG
jgi:toxin ParE1/3/4